MNGNEMFGHHKSVSFKLHFDLQMGQNHIVNFTTV